MRKTLIAALFLLVYTAQAKAQCTAVNNAFLAGEKVQYDLYFNWKFIWKKAGTASFSVTKDTYRSQPAYRFDLLCTGSKQSDSFFKMRDTLTSYVSEKLEPLYYRKAAEEGKRYTIDEVWYSYKDGVSYIKQHRTHNDGNITEQENNDSRCIYDMLSILALVRSFDSNKFQDGEKYQIPIASGRKLEEETLIFRGRKEIKGNDGNSYDCMIFSVVMLNKKGKEQETITFYVSDDENRLPIRLDLYLNIGLAKAYLKSISGNRHPVNSKH